MATVYCAIYGDSDYWDGTTAWGYDATSDVHTPTAHANQAARDAQYTNAFTSVVAWEADRSGNSSSGDDEIGVIQTPWDSDDSAGTCSINGWGTGATGSITLKAIGDSRHSGVWDDGAASPHRLVAAEVTEGLLNGKDPNVILDGLQVNNSEATDTSNSCIFIDDPTTGFLISNCLCKAGSGNGIRVNDASAGIKIWNCIVYHEGVQEGASEGIYLDTVDTAEVYNCTIYNFNDGIEIDAVTTSAAIKNCIVFTNADDIDDTVGVTIDYNASDDGDGDHPQAPSGADWANEMSNYATYDFTLDQSGGNCVGNGVDNPGSGLYSDDITGTARSITWDIGAFEYVAAGGGISLPIVSYYNRRKRN